MSGEWGVVSGAQMAVAMSGVLPAVFVRLPRLIQGGRVGMEQCELHNIALLKQSK